MTQIESDRSRPAAPPRIPPHALEAEESLIGAMLLSPEAVSKAYEMVDPEDFYRPLHGQIFSAILALANAGAHVIAAARTQGALEELDDEILAQGGERATLVPMDLTNGDGIDQLGLAIHQRHGKLDVLVHAGAGGVGLAGDAALADATSGQCDDAQGAVGVGQEDDGLDRSSGGRADGVCWAREERAVHVLSGDIGHEIFGGEHIWKSALSMCNHRRIRLDD